MRNFWSARLVGVTPHPIDISLIFGVGFFGKNFLGRLPLWPLCTEGRARSDRCHRLGLRMTGAAILVNTKNSSGVRADSAIQCDGF